MALNIGTDKEFDEALAWLAKHDRKTKSDVVRELVLERFHARRRGFRYGAFKDLRESSRNRAALQREIESIDDDHDMD